MKVKKDPLEALLRGTGGEVEEPPKISKQEENTFIIQVCIHLWKKNVDTYVQVDEG